MTVDETTEFRVLGPFQVIAGGGRDLRVGGPQQRAVLAILAIRANEVVPASTLVHALWGEPTPPSAMAVTRTYVSRLRKVLSSVDDAQLVSRPPGYALEVDPDQVDANRFARLVRQGRAAAGAGRLDVASASFDEALGLWRAGVLADLDTETALRPEVTRLAEMRLATVEDRVDVLLATGRHQEVVAELESLTEEHPLRERLWGQLIVARYRCGRQADALAAYRSVRSVLVDQVGVEPGPELQALAQDVLDQAPTLRWQAPAHRTNGARVPLPPGTTRAPLVGRDRERARLAEWLDEARTGRFVAAFVSGPSGIGKTTLAGWFSRAAHAGGATVVLGRADDGADVPFLPLGEAVGHWASHVPAARLDLLGDQAATQLARLARVIAHRRGDPLPASLPEPVGPADRQHLFDAVVRWVEVLAADAPALVVLEDLHWADPATLLAIRHLLRHPPEAGALLVLTYRGVELTDVLDHTHHIDLAGLGDADVLELLSARVGGDLGAGGATFAAQLNNVAGGNPLFIHELVEHVTERGAPLPSATSLGGSAAVADVLERRLERLPAPTTTVLRQAAVVGEHFALPVLSAVVGLAEISVVEALEPAVSAGLVTQNGPGHFAFSHALVREAILDSVPLGQRARTHWRTGQAIESLSLSHPDPPLGEIARHLAAGVPAGDPHTAVVANVRAGRQALAALAFEDARTRFATATELAGTAEPELAYQAWLGLGQASAVLADFAGQRDGFLRAAAISRQQRWAERLAAAAIGLPTACGTGDPDDQDTIALVDEALTSLGGARTASRCVLLGIKAELVATLQGGDCRPLATLATELAESIDDPTAQAGALMARCSTLLGSPHPRQLAETAERALSLGTRGPDHLLRFLAPLPPVAALQLGDRDRFDALRVRLATDPTTRQVPHLAAYLRTWDAAVALAEGRFADAEELSTTIPGASDWPLWRLTALGQTRVATRERGKHAPVREDLASYYRSFGPAEEIACPIRSMLAALLAEAGDHTGAAHHAKLVTRTLNLRRLGWNAPFVLRHLAEVAAVLGDAGLAADLLPVLAGYSGQVLVSFTGRTIEAAADRAIGQALLALDRLDEAVDRLTAAQALEDSLDFHALTARTTYWHARTRLRRDAPGDRDTARQLLDQAVTQARKLGMNQLEQEACPSTLTR
jgi:DNA-binding SARP family transcriptional activator